MFDTKKARILFWGGMIGYVLIMSIEFALTLFILLTTVVMFLAVLWYAIYL